jgi:site-specific DNA-methyltransferase (adenine-specific)
MNEAYLIDCMEYMRSLPDKAFDLAIVDPPYGIGVMTMNYTKSGAVRAHGYAAAKRRDYRKQGEWDVRPDEKYFRELFRVSGKQIVWGGNYFSDLLPPSKGFICWDKRCNDTMTNDFSDCEYAWISEELGVARMFRYVWNGMIQGNMKTKEERFHPTQKPVALYKWILSRYAKPGDKILDTHLGSGSSRIAAYDMGFDFVGCEIDKQYFDLQEKRFAEHTSQLSLFLEEIK